LLWSLFFLLGLWPEATFYGLRALGYVFSQNAVINSYHFITWALTGYIIHFTYHRCVEVGIPPLEALGKGIQLGVIAFVAFVDIPLEQIGLIRDRMVLLLVWGTLLLKLAAWIYLYTLILRYHHRRQGQIIANTLAWIGGSVKPEDGPNAPTTQERSASGQSQPMNEQAD
jgi:hypothetical protein